MEKSDRGVIKILSRNLPVRIEKNHENLSVAGLRAEIWTRNLPSKKG
jgi:hypothetical protein